MESLEDTFNRLSIGIIEKNECSPEEALAQLSTFRVLLHCGENIRSSVPLQAALITAVNSGTRAFLGDVFIKMPEDVNNLLPWSNDKSLNVILTDLGARVLQEDAEDLFTLTFGLPGDIDNDKAEVIATNWQGGVFVNGEAAIDQSGSLPMGGVYAGGLAIGLAFLKVSKLHSQALDKSVGLSLWRPDLKWLDRNTEGPESVILPASLWLLGLGHLGQAYIWNIGLLPYSDKNSVSLFLHDFDKAVKANTSAGLLCVTADAGKYKTRICSRWLEDRGIQTRLIERKFDKNTIRNEGEPVIALCGFDNAYSRTLLENAKFDFVVEAGLGDNVDTFDKIMLHTFPSKLHKALEIWKDMPMNLLPNEKVLKALTKDGEKECGILELTIAGKAVSASFVGACAGALVISEVIKGFNQGKSCATLVSQLRFTDYTEVAQEGNQYLTELGCSLSQASLSK
jgi:hypothetical protein